MDVQDTVLAYEAMDDVKNPLAVYETFKVSEHVVVPDGLSAGRGCGSRVVPHLTLESQCHVIGVAGGWGGNVRYSGTSDKGPSEIGMTSLQRTLVAAPC